MCRGTSGQTMDGSSSSSSTFVKALSSGFVSVFSLLQVVDRLAERIRAAMWKRISGPGGKLVLSRRAAEHQQGAAWVFPVLALGEEITGIL